MTPNQEFTIPLTQGKSAIVDAADFEWLSQWKWHAKKDRWTGKFYAKRGAEWMHRIILEINDPKLEGDHINHDTLDNRRSNLRMVTHLQNCQNKRIYANNKSGFKGVHLKTGNRVKNKPWYAQIRLNGKGIFLGYYATPEEAHEAYKSASARFHGEFGKAK